MIAFTRFVQPRRYLRCEGCRRAMLLRCLSRACLSASKMVRGGQLLMALSVCGPIAPSAVMDSTICRARMAVLIPLCHA